MNKKFIYLSSVLAAMLFGACENGDWEFDNYEYTTVYFAYQSPVRDGQPAPVPDYGYYRRCL